MNLFYQVVATGTNRFYHKEFTGIVHRRRRRVIVSCRRFYLLDTSIYIFRAWFGMPDSLRDRHGNSINAVYGFAHFVADLLADTNARYVAGFFDESLGTSFRHELYPAYKANRELPPEDLEYQFRLCKRLLKTLGIRTFASRRYEADDLIASAAHRLSTQGDAVTIVSADKDLAQCLTSSDDRFWHYGKSAPATAHDIQQQFGVTPAQMADYLALCGDAVDNIPGIRGVGSKTASRLLAHFGDISSLLNYQGEVPDLGIRGQSSILQRIQSDKIQLRLFQRLTRLRKSALDSQQVNTKRLRRMKVNEQNISKLLEDELGLNSKLSDKLVTAARFT